MTRDANQIAQEAARREKHLQHGRSVDGIVNRGTLTILTSLGAAAEVISTHKDVTVQFTAAGLVVATYRDGGKIAFQPIPGWAIMFEPNDAER